MPLEIRGGGGPFRRDHGTIERPSTLLDLSNWGGSRRGGADLSDPDPGSRPGDPFPEPARPPMPSESPLPAPIGIPSNDPDVIDPGIGEPLGIPPGAPPEVPGGSEPPQVF